MSVVDWINNRDKKNIMERRKKMNREDMIDLKEDELRNFLI